MHQESRKRRHAWGLSARRVFGFRAVLPAPVRERLTGFGATGNVYEELGVTTVINDLFGRLTPPSGSRGRYAVHAETGEEKIIAAQLVQLFKSHTA